MFTDFYRICKLNIRIDSSEKLPYSEHWAHFACPPCVPDVEISCRACESLPAPTGKMLGGDADSAVYRDADGLHRWVHISGKNTACCSYFGGKNTVAVRGDVWDVALDYRYMWSTAAMPQILIRKGALILHASYIEADGGGIVFAASSGTGKSTQAALWEKYRGAEIINGDKCGITLNGGAEVHGVPVAGTSGLCKNKSLPLRAIVLLKQAPENSVRRLRGAEALSAVMGNVHLDISAAEDRRLALELTMRLADSVPVFELACTPDEGAVEALEKAMSIEK